MVDIWNSDFNEDGIGFSKQYTAPFFVRMNTELDCDCDCDCVSAGE